jgi:2-amino-4-hydroxy-6-hydroxymethyldihydropteridine diphosphokinase
MIVVFIIFEVMNVSYILLGGNIGNTLQIFDNCVSLIGNEIGEVTLSSSIYVSEPWGFSHENKFFNQVLKISTLLNHHQLLQKCQSIETFLGRKRKQENGYQARKIDIDILFFNDLIMENKDLQIPHPRLHLRKFTLLPFLEVESTFTHPKLNKSIEKLLSECPDKSKVIKL